MKTFSPIQNHIISKLKNADSLRYSELMPEEKIANDLFNYHLQYLVKNNFVIKSEDGYSLSDTGVRHVADPFPAGEDKEQKISSLFKVNVITIISRKTEDGKTQILNQLRKSNPSYGKIGVMGGVVYKGEKTEDAAKRKLEEETGLIADFKLLGTTRRIMYKDGELFSDVLFPIAYSDNVTGGELIKETDFGENFWVDIDQAIKNDEPKFDSIYSISKVLKAVKDNTINNLELFYEEDVHVDQ
ncbi:NUDIX hydrolase [Candidatus Pacebacteria bacterium]|nr:NUDIX hydrolase [Candidatus Paceibacterota bacterium]